MSSPVTADSKSTKFSIAFIMNELNIPPLVGRPEQEGTTPGSPQTPLTRTEPFVLDITEIVYDTSSSDSPSHILGVISKENSQGPRVPFSTKPQPNNILPDYDSAEEDDSVVVISDVEEAYLGQTSGVLCQLAVWGEQIAARDPRIHVLPRNTAIGAQRDHFGLALSEYVQRLNVPRNIRSPTGDELLSFAENFKNLLDRPAWCGGLLSVISQDVLDRSIQVTLSDENPQCLVTATALTSIILCIGVVEQNGSNLMSFEKAETTLSLLWLAKDACARCAEGILEAPNAVIPEKFVADYLRAWYVSGILVVKAYRLVFLDHISILIGVVYIRYLPTYFKDYSGIFKQALSVFTGANLEGVAPDPPTVEWLRIYHALNILDMPNLPFSGQMSEFWIQKHRLQIYNNPPWSATPYLSRIIKNSHYLFDVMANLAILNHNFCRDVAHKQFKFELNSDLVWWKYVAALKNLVASIPHWVQHSDRFRGNRVQIHCDIYSSMWHESNNTKPVPDCGACVTEACFDHRFVCSLVREPLSLDFVDDDHLLPEFSQSF
ncbi:hypothetical protein SISSUDRAFT_1059101 [Sistotremastrum suecicum HHB10207 ss-3]|uniref:Uncharacterized protein n=1 Tax=Sistotremastrum suecicum HHB10207 ss-3 TaxID=1314776 RepID=A0A166GL14_9AGAM|nr:hypothetical protein SISSUDRAFT_1059101 [Sistotremastrum suecicum HHB10207 ss-3]